MWGKARKKPVVVEYREPIPNDQVAVTTQSTAGTFVGVESKFVEKINTREGTLYGYPGKDFIIKGVRGEIYPIGIDIFNETYDVVESIPQSSNQKVIK